MAVISDLLGIPHFTTSRGSTVRSDFLESVLRALGGDPRGLNKEQLIIACGEAASRTPFDRTLLSPGGTVTNRVLQLIVDGITQHGIPGRLAAGRPNLADDEVPEVVAFDPADIQDQWSRAIAARAAREGQDRFRTNVLEAYGARCAVTGANAASALEAAHITPYRGPATNVIANGICLRADVHRLWDSRQVAIHEDSLEVVIVEALRATTYAALAGTRVRLPRNAADHPSVAALRAHRHWCGL
jgi:hypothetical protein